MPKKAKEQTAMWVSTRTKPGLHFVGGVAGLALQVLPSGGKTWILRVKIGDRRREMGLGGFPDVTLAGAREAARAAREKIRSGIDPIDERRAAISRLKASAASVTSFKAAAIRYIADNESGWKNATHRKQWQTSLETYAYPKIGALSVADIRTDHVLDIVKPLWKSKTETANRVRGRIELVLDAAKAEGRIADPWQNPARWRGHLDKLLPARSKVAKPKHQPALPYQRINAFMSELRKFPGMGPRGLEFLVLTVVRPANVRFAAWPQINFDTNTWTIFDDDMKAGREHRVPLSTAAVALLRALPKIAGTDLIFPAPRGGALSDATLSAVVKRMHAADRKAGGIGYLDPKEGKVAVAHGFRSTFRDWAAEVSAYPNEMAEMALAHAVGDKTEAAYRRGDLFKKRQKMMDDWAKFIDTKKTAPGGNVVPMLKRRG